jgi:hypothetical protein
MEFTGTTQAELRSARIRLRDEAVQQPAPPGGSRVSDDALLEATRAAQARVASARGSRAGTDIDTAIAAATLPPTGRTQTDRTAGADGAGTRPGAHRTDRGRGDGPTRGK